MLCRATLAPITSPIAPSAATADPVRPDRRAELAEAAYRMIAERGLEGMSLRALARSLGATTGLVSHHFADRADLVEAAHQHASQVMNRRIAGVDDAGDPFSILAAVLPTDDESIRNWRFSVSVRAASIHDPAMRPLERAMVAAWQRHFPTLLADHVDVDPVVAARQLMILVEGISLHAVLDPEQWPPETQLEQLRLGLRGLGASPPTT